MSEGEKNLVQTLKLVPKIIGLAVAIGVVYIMTGPVVKSAMGAEFPAMFKLMFSCFAIAGFVLFVLLDVPEMKKQEGFGSWRNIIITMLLFSAILVFAGSKHPQFKIDIEVAKMNRPPIKEMPSGPEAVAAGKAVFDDNKCSNCHKTLDGGSSDRGPNFAVNQIGAYSIDLLKVKITNPRKEQPWGYREGKAPKEMPTYYGEDLSKMDLDLLIVFLQTQVDDTKMPVWGAPAEKKAWEEFPEFVEEGKRVFMGEANEEVNCSVCHGADGIPLMSDAADLRNKGWQSKRNPGKTLGDMTHGEWYKSVSLGVEDTAMASWLEMGLTRYQLWCVISYVRKTLTKL